MNLFRSCITLLLCCFFVATGMAQTANPTQRIRGTLVALDGLDLQMKSDSGELLKVKLSSDYRIGTVAPGDLAKIAADAYIGVAAMPQPDGTLNAIDIRVFPESMRGTGEGHRPMDGPAGPTMTNATVAAVAPDQAAGRTMTNATVSEVTGAETRRLTVKYATGEKVVLVPPGTPVLLIGVGNKEMLVAGSRIVVGVSKQLDGSLLGERITVGLKGAVPPL